MHDMLTTQSRGLDLGRVGRSPRCCAGRQLSVWRVFASRWRFGPEPGLCQPWGGSENCEVLLAWGLH